MSSACRGETITEKPANNDTVRRRRSRRQKNLSFLYVNLEGMNQEQDLAIATQRPSEGGGERIPKPFDQLPRLAAETTADNPWPVSVLSQKFHTAVERWPAAWIAGQITEINKIGRAHV